MTKEILLYTSLYSYSVASFINEVTAANDNDLKIRINCVGGVVTDAYGIIAKLKEHKGKKEFQIDGSAYSMGAYLPLFRGKEDVCNCLDTSEFLFHRAAYQSYYESNSDFMTEDRVKSLTKMNETLRASIESKCTAEEWEKVTGTSLDDMFSTEKRIDIMITAEQAKELNFVDSITTITPEKKAEIEALSMQVASAAMAIKQDFSNTNKKETMTISELKKDHSALYAEVVAEERTRISALMAFAAIDLDSVAKAIEDGSSFTPKEMADFAIKLATKAPVAQVDAVLTAEIETGAAANVDVTKVVVDNNPNDTSKQVSAFEDHIAELTGLSFKK